MPGWDDILGPSEIDALAEEVRGFGPHATWSRNEDVPPVPALVGDAQRGRDLYVNLGCPSCHGDDGRGGGASAAALRDVWKQPAPPRDLTAPWSFRGGATPAALFRRIADGISGTPMPGYLEVASAQQIIDVVAYLATIARAPSAGATADGEPPAVDARARGEALVHVGMCATCHASPGDAAPGLAGGRPIDAGAHGVLFASNLTPDVDTGLGRMSTAAIALAIQTGHRRGNRLNLVAMPWVLYGSLAAEDALAMATYLQSLPPVRRHVPPPLRYGFVETVLRKLTYSWPANLPPRLTLLPATAGSDPPIPAGRSWESWGISAQVLLLALAVLSLFRAPASSAGEEPHSSAVLMSAVVASLVVATATLVVYWYPALDAIPAKPLVDAFTSSVPSAPSDNASVQRGRDLYIAGCAFCHNGNGAGGGKINAVSFGSVWSANLTAHESGLASWSDAAILRAVVSGVRRDGRGIHPDSMPWPMLSRLSVDDQQALLAFLRRLPAIDHQVPSAQAPRADDCRGVTFWIGTSSRDPGCR